MDDHDYLFRGLPVTVEKWKGERRHNRILQADYGFIPDTTGRGDGEAVDVYVGDDHHSPHAYVVEQLKEDGSFDEYKVMLGFESLPEAEAVYLAQFDPGWRETRVQAIHEVPVEEFLDVAEDNMDEDPKTAAAHREWWPYGRHKFVPQEGSPECKACELPADHLLHTTPPPEKQASFQIEAEANYDEMFAGLNSIIQNALPPVDGKSGVAISLHQDIQDEINWAKNNLHKNYRIVWFLRWAKLELIQMGSNKAYTYFGKEKDTDKKTLNEKAQNLALSEAADLINDTGQNSRMDGGDGDLDHRIVMKEPNYGFADFDEKAAVEYFSNEYGIEKKLKEIEPAKVASTKIVEDYETPRLKVQVTGSPQRLFFEGTLKPEAHDWLTKVNFTDKVVVNFTVDLGADGEAYLNRLDSDIRYRGFGPELMKSALGKIAEMGYKHAKTYIENDNYASQAMVKKLGGTEVPDSYNGQGSYYEFNMGGSHKEAVAVSETGQRYMALSGDKIVEEATIGEYELMVVKSGMIPNIYQVGLQRIGMDAFDPMQQLTKTPNSRGKGSLAEVKRVLNHWLQKYGELVIASHNPDKTPLYVAMVKRLGFKVDNLNLMGWRIPCISKTAAVDDDDETLSELDKLYPKMLGDTCGSLKVRGTIPNLESISAGYNNDEDWTELPGVRVVKMKSEKEYEYVPHSSSEDRYTKRLKSEIIESMEINPLIVVIDNLSNLEDYYILEGGHRFDALLLMGIKEFPAIVVVETE